MEFEAVDEGTIAKILVAEGTDGVKVGTPIAILAGEGEDASALPRRARAQGRRRRRRRRPKSRSPSRAARARAAGEGAGETPAAAAPQPAAEERRATASRPRRSRAAWPRRRASTCRALKGCGPGGRIVRADLGEAAGGAMAAPRCRGRAAAPAATPSRPFDRATSRTRRSSCRNMRKTIARRLTESKQQIPHIYLTRRHPARRAAQAARRAERGARRAAASSSASTTC